MSTETDQSLETLRFAFDQIIEDELYQAGLDWGKPRSGHDEGTIRAHIQELESNLDYFYGKNMIDDVQRMKLLILIHVHDIRKIHATPGSSIDSPYSHASLAREFLSKFLDDEDMLNMVQYHDESFALYRRFEKKGSFNQDRLDRLVSEIEDWDLFLIFNIIDNHTAGKSNKPLRWFMEQVKDRVKTQVDDSWFIRS